MAMDEFNDNSAYINKNKIIILLNENDYETCIKSKELDVSIITVGIDKNQYSYCPSSQSQSQSQTYGASSDKSGLYHSIGDIICSDIVLSITNSPLVNTQPTLAP